MTKWVPYAMLVFTLVGWPLSLYFFPEEPPVVMSLSWLALVYTAYDAIMTGRVENKQKEATP